jgi:O-antigen ligase
MRTSMTSPAASGTRLGGSVVQHHVLIRLALWGLTLFVFSIPSENGVTIPGIGSLSRLIGLAAIGLTAISLFDRGRLRLRGPSLFMLVAVAFVAWLALTYFWSAAPSVSLSRIVQYAQLLAFAWMVHQLARTERDQDMLMQAFVIGCYVMIAVAVAATLGASRGDYRDVVFPANSFAIVAALAIPMAWGLVLRHSFPWLRALNMAYPVFAFVAVILAASRGGLLTALVGFLVVPMTLLHLSTLRRIVLITAVTVVALSVSTWLPQAVPDLERNLERLARVEEDLIGGTMTVRTDIWAAGAEVFVTSPIVGVGIGTYSRVIEPILGSARVAHNAFWSIAVTTGIVGLTLFVGMFVVVLVGVVASPQRRTEYSILLAALIVASMPSNAESDKFLWYILAVLASARPVMLTVRNDAASVPTWWRDTPHLPPASIVEAAGDGAGPTGRPPAPPIVR